MRKKKALKFLYIYQRMDNDDKRILSALLELIRKNRILNGGLMVIDCRSISSHVWKSVSKTKVASWFGLTSKELDDFMLYMNWDIIMEELAQKYADDLISYHPEIGIGQAIKSALMHLGHDDRFKDAMAKYGIVVAR